MTSEAMSTATSISDQMAFSTDTPPIVTLSKSLEAILSEVITLIQYIDKERDIFLQTACYLYRLTPIIMELKKTDNAPTGAMEILQSLHTNTQFAKDVLEKARDKGTIPRHELSTMIKQLEVTIKHMGEHLSSMPALVFEDREYAKITLSSLSEEMKNAHFGATQTPNNSMQPTRSLGFEENLNVASSQIASDSESIWRGTNSQSSHSQSVQVLKSLSMISDIGSRGGMSPGSIRSIQRGAPYVEPLFESFCCPLTKEIMDDPVTIHSGVTFERDAITTWFEEVGDSEEVTCPKTGTKLLNRDLNPNIALKAAIDEWKDRNGTAMIHAIHTALSTSTSESIIVDALRDLQNICVRRPDKIIVARTIGIIPLLAKLLELRDRKVRYVTLEALRLLAEDDDGKELIGTTTAITTTVMMLSSGYQPVRHATLLLLLELSKSQFLSERIGWVTGGILMLIRMNYNKSADPFASDMAAQVLKNLAQCPNNIRSMAENGFLDPLLDILIEGSDEMKLVTASYLGEVVLGADNSSYVAQRASPALIKMVQSGNPLNRKAAFKAFTNLSSHFPNGRILVEAGIVEIVVKELFTGQIHDESVYNVREAAILLANILDSSVNLEDVKVSGEGHTMASEYVVLKTIELIMKSNPYEIDPSLIRILLSLAKYSGSEAAIVFKVKESEATNSMLFRVINDPNEELAIAALKLLSILSTQMGHILVDRLCQTKGQPEGLIQIPPDITQITEKHALSAKLLADLPHQNLNLNVALLRSNTVPMILQTIDQIKGSGTLQGRYTGAYLVALVGIIVRFTATIYDSQILFLVRNNNFTAVFTHLLMETSIDEIKRLASAALERLSVQTVHLSEQPAEKRRSSCCFAIQTPKEEPTCPIHGGVCSTQNSFCLIKSGAVEGLLECLDHRNVEVVESALLALATLLDDSLDVDKSVIILDGMNATGLVIRVLKDHKKESLLQKVFWVIERFLSRNSQRTAAAILVDRIFSDEVVTAFHHGEPYTKQMAERILRYLNKMPNVTSNFTTTFTL